MEQIVSVKNRNGLNMSIKLNVSTDRRKCVFLIHGLGARKTIAHMQVLEDVFAEKGFNVVNIDTTDSNNDSERSEIGVTFSGFCHDLEDVIAWAKTQDFYCEPFALAGQSLGAQAVVWFASKNPEKVNLLVPVAFCWLDGKEASKTNSRREQILDQGYYDQVSKSTGKVLRITKAYLDDMENYNFEGEVSKILAETFILVPENDADSRVLSSKRLFELLGCKKQLIVLKGASHDPANTPETKKVFEDTIFNILKNK